MANRWVCSDNDNVADVCSSAEAIGVEEMAELLRNLHRATEEMDQKSSDFRQYPNIEEVGTSHLANNESLSIQRGVSHNEISNPALVSQLQPSLQDTQFGPSLKALPERLIAAFDTISTSTFSCTESEERLMDSPTSCGSLKSGEITMAYDDRGEVVPDKPTPNDNCPIAHKEDEPVNITITAEKAILSSCRLGTELPSPPGDSLESGRSFKDRQKLIKQKPSDKHIAKTPTSFEGANCPVDRSERVRDRKLRDLRSSRITDRKKGVEISNGMTMDGDETMRSQRNISVKHTIGKIELETTKTAEQNSLNITKSPNQSSCSNPLPTKYDFAQNKTSAEKVSKNKEHYKYTSGDSMIHPLLRKSPIPDDSPSTTNNKNTSSVTIDHESKPSETESQHRNLSRNPVPDNLPLRFKSSPDLRFQPLQAPRIDKPLPPIYPPPIPRRLSPVRNKPYPNERHNNNIRTKDAQDTSPTSSPSAKSSAVAFPLTATSELAVDLGPSSATTLASISTTVTDASAATAATTITSPMLSADTSTLPISTSVSASAAIAAAKTPHEKALAQQVAQLQRENTMLSAALSAVLATAGTRNRCTCGASRNGVRLLRSAEEAKESGGRNREADGTGVGRVASGSVMSRGRGNGNGGGSGSDGSGGSLKSLGRSFGRYGTRSRKAKEKS